MARPLTWDATIINNGGMIVHGISIDIKPYLTMQFVMQQLYNLMILIRNHDHASRVSSQKGPICHA